MKLLSTLLLAGVLSFSAMAQDAPAKLSGSEERAKAEAELDKKAAEWVASLNLNDADKEKRVAGVISTHLKAVRDWHNLHSFETVPAGIDPATGKALGPLDRQVIASSAIPKTVHENVMAGLRKDLTEEQVELILDKYTIGKVAFTLNGYKSIVTDLTPVEEKVILDNLKQAREQAIDFKNVKLVSAIFEIYKTKNEQYLNANGRNWHQLFKTYVETAKAKKAAAKAN
jgi:hypothetical protein